MDSRNHQANINARVYHAAGIVNHYRKDTLAREDCVALLKYQPAVAGRDVLDIGAGTGRTAIYLAPLARRYRAIDYSGPMVREFERMFPSIPITLADMRDLSPLPDADYDFVLASNNVFDAVGHEDRLHTLEEMHRLLRPGGILMFSSHNRDVEPLMEGPHLDVSRNPITLAKNALHMCKALANHARLRKLQVLARDFAIINDAAHDCGLLHYYIGPEAQRRQLQVSGFELLEVFDRYGAPVPTGASTGHSRWLLYVARRMPLT